MERKDPEELTAWDFLEAGIIPEPDHSVKRTTNCNENPTAGQDAILDAHEEVDQYPPPQEMSRYVYSDDPEEDDESTYPWFGGDLLRCSRQKYQTLAEAQTFFDGRRIVMEWSHEGPIYRTGRFWCKRVYRNGK